MCLCRVQPRRTIGWFPLLRTLPRSHSPRHVGRTHAFHLPPDEEMEWRSQVHQSVHEAFFAGVPFDAVDGVEGRRGTRRGGTGTFGADSHPSEEKPTGNWRSRRHVGVRGEMHCSPLEVTHVEHIDPVVEKERERLIRVGMGIGADAQKYGKKRLNRLIRRYFRKKEEMESRKRDAWLHEEFRRDCGCLLNGMVLRLYQWIGCLKNGSDSQLAHRESTKVKHFKSKTPTIDRTLPTHNNNTQTNTSQEKIAQKSQETTDTRQRNKTTLHRKRLRLDTLLRNAGKRLREDATIRFALLQLLTRILPLLVHILEPRLLGLELGRVQHVRNVHRNERLLVDRQIDLIHQVFLALAQNNLTRCLQVVCHFHHTRLQLECALSLETMTLGVHNQTRILSTIKKRV